MADNAPGMCLLCAAMLIWTHGFWGLFAGASGPEGAGERRRRARRSHMAPLAFFGGGLGIRIAAARLLAGAIQRRLTKWRNDARRRRAHKLG